MPRPRGAGLSHLRRPIEESGTVARRALERRLQDLVDLPPALGPHVVPLRSGRSRPATIVVLAPKRSSVHAARSDTDQAKRKNANRIWSGSVNVVVALIRMPH